MSKWTNKQTVFADEYLIDFNATRAAERAGYVGNDVTLAAVGYENLRKPHIAERISQRLQERAMSVDEALDRLAEQVRFDTGPYLVFEGDEVGVNLQALKDAGLTHLVKSVTPTRYGYKIEFEDRQTALNMLLKAHGAYKDVHEVHGTVVASSLTDEQLEQLFVGIAERARKRADTSSGE